MSRDEARLDGRSMRRERNVESVLDAVHGLFVDGHLDPPVEEVATRSGVSLRSIYRYFPDREQLLMAALQRRLKVADPLFVLDGAGSGGEATTLDDRIAVYLDHRMQLYALVAPTVRVAVIAGRQMPAVAEVVRVRRASLTEQVRRHFGPELDRLEETRADDVVLAVEMLCQLESVEALCVERGLSEDHVRRVLGAGLRALLTATA